MHEHVIQLSRSIKQAIMMLFDGVMIILALGFSFALLGMQFLGQEQVFYLYGTVAIILSILVLFP